MLNQFVLHPEYGDQYIFVALDAETKLVAAHCVGKRDLVTATIFFELLKSRLRGRSQITTDAWRSYREVIEDVFGSDCSYAQVGGGSSCVTFRPWVGSTRLKSLLRSQCPRK